MNKDYYVVLHGAKKNVGDFLIRDRAKVLLKHLRPDRELVEFPSWKSLDDKLDIINNAKALIIMGGPGANSCFYPKNYPLLKNIKKLKVPFVMLGTGSYEKLYDKKSLQKIKFCDKTLDLFSKDYFISTRDYLSNEIFTQNNIISTMTGCPTFYNLNYIGRPLSLTENKKIVFTPPANMIFKYQAIKIMYELKKYFSDYKIFCSFNRGFKADKYTLKKYEKDIKEIVDTAKKLNFIIRDTSYELEKIDFYNQCDFHIGYRLHSHIHFISRRAPSFLISEDSRSYGHMHSLNLQIFQGEKDNIYSKIYSYRNKYVNYIINKYFSPTKAREDVVESLINYILKEVNNEFKSFTNIPLIIDSLYNKKMKPFIKSLP